jgi:hypothetical protein
MVFIGRAMITTSRIKSSKAMARKHREKLKQDPCSVRLQKCLTEIQNSMSLIKVATNQMKQNIITGTFSVTPGPLLGLPSLMDRKLVAMVLGPLGRLGSEGLLCNPMAIYFANNDISSSNSSLSVDVELCWACFIRDEAPRIAYIRACSGMRRS